MLRTLTISNIALIDKSEIEFTDGLNILTGETGAGKSIIIDSLNFVMGCRADKTLIRYGETEATVEAEFINVNDRVRSMLEEFEIEYDDELIISRKMTTEGKNVCRINGVKLTVSALKDIAGAMVDIYGQHENSVLLSSDTHIGIIDNFGGKSLDKIKSDYKNLFKEYKKTLSEIDKYGSLQDVNKKLDTLQRQIKEIKDAEINPGEEERLVKKCDIYDNAEEILSALTNAHILLNGDMDNNALDNIGRAFKELSKITDYDKEISDCTERLEELRIELSDISSTLGAHLDRVDFDEYEARDTINRLEKIRNIESKYGNTEEDVLEYLDKIEEEYDYYSNSEFELDKLEKNLTVLKEELYNKAKLLTEKRKKVSKEFSVLVEAEMKELGMPNTKFVIEFGETYDMNNFLSYCNSEGADRLEFLISPNAGQPPKSLSKIISGGEMSRFMLAIKKISAELDGVNVMVFDEIDTGISGKIAGVVAKKLYDISVDRQVLAVTHLPQLASMADSHYLIEKTSDNITTETNVRLLNPEEDILEIARIIGGAEDSEYAIPHAKEMKNNSNLYKSQIR